MAVLAHESRGGAPRLEPSGRGGRVDPAAVRVARARRRASGPGAARPGRACASASLDSGVELDHPRVGTVERSVAVSKDGDEITIADDTAGDLCGHGTACAGIIRSLAPECELTSVRVLGAGYTGSAAVLLAGLEWAIDAGLRHHQHEPLDDEEAVRRAGCTSSPTRRTSSGTMLIASAHNMPVESFPWRFAAVVSVGSHESTDPFVFYANPRPPVEFFARGLERRGRVARRRDDHRDRQQLRDAACRRHLRAHSEQASAS